MGALNVKFSGLNSLFQAQVRRSEGKDSEENSTYDDPKIQDVFMKGDFVFKAVDTTIR